MLGGGGGEGEGGRGEKQNDDTWHGKIETHQTPPAHRQNKDRHQMNKIKKSILALEILLYFYFYFFTGRISLHFETKLHPARFLFVLSLFFFFFSERHF